MLRLFKTFSFFSSSIYYRKLKNYFLPYLLPVRKSVPVPVVLSQCYSVFNLYYAITVCCIIKKLVKRPDRNDFIIRPLKAGGRNQASSSCSHGQKALLVFVTLLRNRSSVLPAQFPLLLFLTSCTN